MYPFKIKSKFGFETISMDSLAELQRVIIGGPMLEKEGDEVEVVTHTNRSFSITKNKLSRHHTYNGYSFNH